MVAFWAKNLQAGTFEGLTSHPNITPTILNAMNLDQPADATITGSVVGSMPDERVVYAYHGKGDLSATTAQVATQRLFYFWDGTVEYYVDDETETQDVYDSTNKDLQSLWDCLRSEAEDMATHQNTSAVPVWPSDL